MNAVAATTNFDPSMLAASVTAPTAAPAQTNTPSGFVNLINALLTPPESAPPETVQASPSSFQDDSQSTTSESVPVRSSSEIADALIRSMLGSSLSAGNLFSDHRPAIGQMETPKDRRASDSQPTADVQTAAAHTADVQTVIAQPAPLPIGAAPVCVAPVCVAPATIMPAAIMSQGLGPVQIALPATSPALRVPSSSQSGTSKFLGNTATLPADPRPATGHGLPAGPQLTTGQGPVAQAGLAFALRLTPFENPEKNPPAGANPKAAPVVLASATPAKAAPVTTGPIMEAPAAPPAPAPTREVAQAIPAAPDQNQIAPVVENSPAPIEPQPKGKDNTPSDTAHTATVETKPRQGSDQNNEATPAVMAVSAAGDRNGNFERPLPTPLPVPAAPHSSEPAPQQAVRTVEQALRAEVSAPAAAPKGSAVQEIAVRIAGPEASAVDLHMIERAGQVHVSVRSADPGLQTSLRQDLGTLVNSLERSGYRTEAFTSHDGGTLAGIGTQMDARSAGQDAGQNGAPQNRTSQDKSGQDGSGQDRSGQNRSDQGGSHDSNGGQQQRRRQQHDWIDTLEKTQ